MKILENRNQSPLKGLWSGIWARCDVLVYTIITLFIFGFVFREKGWAVIQFIGSTLVSVGLKPLESVKWSAAAVFTATVLFVIIFVWRTVLNRKKMRDKHSPPHSLVSGISVFLAAIVAAMTIHVQAVEITSSGVNAGKIPKDKSPAPVILAKAESIEKPLPLQSNPGTNSWDMIQSLPFAVITPLNNPQASNQWVTLGQLGQIRIASTNGEKTMVINDRTYTIVKAGMDKVVFHGINDETIYEMTSTRTCPCDNLRNQWQTSPEAQRLIAWAWGIFIGMVVATVGWFCLQIKKMLDKWFSTNEPPPPGPGLSNSFLAGKTSFSGNTASVPARLTYQMSASSELTLPNGRQSLITVGGYDGTNKVKMTAYPKNYVFEGLSLTNAVIYLSMDISGGDLAAVGTGGSNSLYFQVCTNITGNYWADDTVPRNVQMWFISSPPEDGPASLISVTAIVSRGGEPYALMSYDLTQVINFNTVFTDMLMTGVPVSRQKPAEYFRLRFTP